MSLLVAVGAFPKGCKPDDVKAWADAEEAQETVPKYSSGLKGRNIW
jgi:hypothetical protein